MATATSIVSVVALGFSLLIPVAAVAQTSSASQSPEQSSSQSAAVPPTSRTAAARKLTAKQKAAINRARKKAAAKKAAAAAAAKAAAAKKKPSIPVPVPSPLPAPNPTPTPTPTPPANPIPDGSLTVTSFGAVGDGATDDCAALQGAINAAVSGQAVVFPAGRVFAHSCVLRVGTAGIRLTGGGQLLATNEQRASLFIDAGSVSVDNLSFTTVLPTRRWEEYEKMRIRIGAVSNTSISDVRVEGSGAAGIYVGGASNFSINRVEVANTRADAVHITEGAHDGTLTDVTVRNPGDDGIAVVSYLSNGVRCQNITVTRPKLLGQQWGRGFSVVGGDHVTFRDIYAEGSSAASVYVASEAGGYNTFPATNVLVDGGVISNANQASSIDHGAVMLYNGRSGVNSDIAIQNLSISGTRYTASRQIGIVQDSGGTHARVSFSNINIVGGSTPFGGNAPSASYNRTNVTHNGVVLPNLQGWN